MNEYQVDLAKQLSQQNEAKLAQIADENQVLALNARHLYHELKRAEVENPLVKELMRSLALSGERIEIALPHDVSPEVNWRNSNGMRSLGLSGKGFDILVQRNACDNPWKGALYKVGDILTDGIFPRRIGDYDRLVSPTSARLRHYSVTMEDIMDIIQREAESRTFGTGEA